MPLSVPNLDDRTFDQLAAEARSLLPRYSPEWTDHNPSDPGITLLELFAFLAETAIYQLNRIPERSLENFAALVGVKREPGEKIEGVLRRSAEENHFRFRAVTQEDYEALAREAAPGLIARAKVVITLEEKENVSPEEQTLQVILLPDDALDPEPDPSPGLCQRVFAFLRQRGLITTRIRTRGAEYTAVKVGIVAVRDAGARMTAGAVEEAVRGAVLRFLNPVRGGTRGEGWEFGRPVYRSELYQVIEGSPGVDHVQALLLNGDETRGWIEMSSPLSLVRVEDLAVAVVDL